MTLVWRAYSDAYAERYGTAPTPNKRSMGQLAQFVQRVPADEAPGIAAAYVRSRESFYVLKKHPIGSLLADAEKLRTEFVTGRSGTATGARREDANADKLEQYGEILDWARREDELEAERKLANGST